MSREEARGLPWSLRPVAWGMAWSLIVQTWADHVWGWGTLACIIIGIPAYAVACLLATNHSLRWRYLMARHWHRLERPLVLNEDADLYGALLPFEELHVMGDDDGPIGAHVHTRTLLLGRHRLRAVTVWREVA